jgi:hypothetical protein
MDVTAETGPATDAGDTDAASSEAGADLDANAPDAAAEDSATIDAVADTSVADTSVADTSVADTSVADTSVADAARNDVVADSGCGALMVCGAACVDTTRDARHCGRCDNACPTPMNATASCALGVCGSSCNMNFHACGGACVSNSAVASCGASCTPCVAPANATATCNGTACGFTCNAGFSLVGGACVIAAPRLVSPMSNATVTSRRPNVRWANAAMVTGAQVQFCRDRACATVIETVAVSASSAAPTMDLPRGTVFWRARGTVGAATGTSDSPTWQFIVGQRSAPVNTSAGSTADVNGDGLADIIVTGGAAVGVNVFHGNRAGVSGTASTVVANAGGYTTQWVGDAGDLNGDGFTDLATIQLLGPMNVQRRIAIFYGGPTGLATTPSFTTGDLPFVGGATFVIGSAGDVDGDGYGDLIAGAASAPGGGAAYFFRGSASGIGAMPTTTIAAFAGAQGFGEGASSAGDLNGDGFGDVVISGVGYGAGTRPGTAAVYYGSAMGLSTTPLVLASASALPMSIGYRVAAGDLNGDGYTDLVSHAIYNNFQNPPAQIWYGRAGMLTAMPNQTIASPAPYLFDGSCTAGSDINGDGYGDVVFTEHAHASGRASGNLFPYYGGPMGIVNAAPVRITSPSTNGRLGLEMSDVGDVNGDGFDDIVGSATYATPTQTFLFLGRAPGLNPAISQTFTGPAFTGAGVLASFDRSWRVRRLLRSL